MKVFTDGASRGNPGLAGIGIYSPNKIKHKKFLGRATNNIAEYTAVLEALKIIKEENLEFYLDSELAVKQLNKEYKVKNKEIKKIYEQIQELVKGRKVTFEWIPREENKEADALANQAIDSKAF